MLTQATVTPMYLGNIEPSLDELLDDAMMGPLLSRAGTSADAVRTLVSEAKRKLAPACSTKAAGAGALLAGSQVS